MPCSNQDPLGLPGRGTYTTGYLTDLKKCHYQLMVYARRDNDPCLGVPCPDMSLAGNWAKTSFRGLHELNIEFLKFIQYISETKRTLILPLPEGVRQISILESEFSIAQIFINPSQIKYVDHQRIKGQATLNSNILCIFLHMGEHLMFQRSSHNFACGRERGHRLERGRLGVRGWWGEWDTGPLTHPRSAGTTWLWLLTIWGTQTQCY